MLTELHPVIEISLLAGIPALVALWGKHTFVSKMIACESRIAVLRTSAKRWTR